MSTTLNVNSIADLSVVATLKGETIVWVLEIPAFDTSTNKWSLQEFTISGEYVKLTSSGRSSGNHLLLQVETLTTAPSFSPAADPVRSPTSPFRFGGGPRSPQAYIVIEDITMGYDWPNPNAEGIVNLAQDAVVINVEATSNPGKYEHRIWKV